MGQFMVFRRAALAAIGGIGCAAGQLVDDMYLGRRVHEAGLRNVMSRVPLRIATGGMSAREFWPVYRRWLQFSRNGLPLSFTWPQWLIGIEFFALVAAALLAVAAGATTAAGVALLALFGLGWHLYTIGTVYGGAPLPLRWLWTPFALLGAAPAVVLANVLRPEVHWRGRDYRVDRAAALVPSAPELDSPDAAPVNGKDGHTQAFPGAAAP
jgi:ceramide glucosyltransferase